MLDNFSIQLSYMIILVFKQSKVITNSINMNISTSSANSNMLNSRCRSRQTFNSSILPTKIILSYLRQEIESLQLFSSLVKFLHFQLQEQNHLLA
jgi:hypothetical protein